MPKSKIVFFLVLIVLVIFYVGGCRRLGNWLVLDDKPEHSDAMVLLMGGISDRVLQAVDLYHEGKARRLVIVEEGMGPYKTIQARGATIISNTTQICNAAISMGVPPDSIVILDGDARSTLSEVVIIRDYLAENRFVDTLILVTSAPHTRRARMMFESAFRANDMQIKIHCSPSAYSSFNAERWWRDKEGIQDVLSEVIKIGNLLIFEKKQLKN